MINDTRRGFLDILSAREGAEEVQAMEAETADSQPELTTDGPDEVEEPISPREDAPVEEAELEAQEEVQADEPEVEAPAPKPSETNRKFMQMLREKPANCRKYLGRRTGY